MPKRTTANRRNTELRIALVTLDGHLGGAADRAIAALRRDAPGVSVDIHSAGEWGGDAGSLARCREDIHAAHIVVVCMLFVEEHIAAIIDDLRARRDACDAMLCFMSAGEVMKLTRIGSFAMDGKPSGPLSLLKRLGAKKRSSSNGAGQMAVLRKLPRILKFIPGTAQDVRAYFLAMQYWLAGSEENIRNLLAMLVTRYAAGPRAHYCDELSYELPREYPETGLYHPTLEERVTTTLKDLPAPKTKTTGTVGLLVMRSYILAGNSKHYDAVIASLEKRGLRVIPAFASGLDARPAIDAYFMVSGKPIVDAVVSLTGFSLVGGPAYNDARSAEKILAELDVPYIAAHASEFQSLEAWRESESGLLPIETTLMVAIPELDGATGPTLFAGRSDHAPTAERREMQPELNRVDMLARRVAKLVRLRRTERRDRRIGIVLFNFPPNGGATGTAAYLSVFKSLHNTLKRLASEGYDVEVPPDADTLRDMIINGNGAEFGMEANVHDRISTDAHVRSERWLEDIEREWGPAPGRAQTDGSSILVLGRSFGKVFVGIQPAFGYEGDPMRLLFDRNLTPTHAFSAFYRYLREDLDIDAVLHFGTHGALEFMPGKQSGMTGDCWPDRLIADVPNFYLYAANNPSEGTIAKRRSAATLISYLTPAVTRAGLYKELADLDASIDRWRTLDPEALAEREQLTKLITAQAAELELTSDAGADRDATELVSVIAERLEELRNTLIPEGLHVLGEAPTDATRREWLTTLAEAAGAGTPSDADLDAIAAAGESGAATVETTTLSEDVAADLLRVTTELDRDSELAAIVQALDGRFIRPAPGGDLMRTTDILPTGRNMHGFDPYRMPSRFAMLTGAAQADELVQRFRDDNGRLPESIAIVLWGTDNIKTEGGPIAQALRLMGAEPRFDSYGRLAGAELLTLEELGRPRVDAVMTLSGIFRDLLPNQTRLLADAAYLAASADEPPEQNFVRKHALEYQQRTGCDFETAALRVFSNAAGAYGSNVNVLVDSGNWEDDDKLAEQYSSRKCFAYGRSGQPARQPELLAETLGDVDMSYQNLESAELGVTTIDHYFDTLGGISRAVQRAKGEAVEVYIGDQTGENNTIRTLAEQVALESRTRVLNPKWYEGMLEHGYEGVKQIESHVTNTMGWSATTGKVAPWVYQQISDTFILDEDMRRRLASLNPQASAKVANRLLEAHERQYWSPDPETLAALERAGEELEDVLEGISEVAAA